MAYSRLLKTNLVLLVLVVIGIVASSIALYAGNKKFIGILGIALLALFLVFWRIFILTRSRASPNKNRSTSTSTPTSSNGFARRRSDTATSICVLRRFHQMLITTVLTTGPLAAAFFCRSER